MALFERRTRDDHHNEPDLSQLRGWHLLLVPDDVPIAQVDELVRYRYPDSRLAEHGRTALGRGSAISGPHLLQEDERDDVKVPPPWTVSYALEVEREPDPEAFADIADPAARAWWMRAFPQGKPFREEARAVDLALSLARRLGGELRASGSNALLRPDPERLLDLTVWSGFWLDPDRLRALLGPVLPGAYIDLDAVEQVRPGRQEPGEVPWSADPLDPVTLDLEHALDDQDRARVHDVADQHDAAALQRPFTIDGYALTADGDLVVEVTHEDAVPAWVRAAVADQQPRQQDPLVTYSVRWLPEEAHLLESEDPPYRFRMQRERVRSRHRSAVRALAEATAGVISDSAGFQVDRYLL
ncbi:MAG: hypothetical protein ACRC35_03615 [Angustibacter sp.]